MDLSTFNQALLLKWYWQWGKPHTTLCRPLLQQNIGHNGLPDSPIFNNAMSKLIKFCIFAFRHHPGNGEKIIFWDNKWRGVTLDAQFPNLYTFTLNTTTTLKQALNTASIDTLFRSNLFEIAQEELLNLKLLLTGVTLDTLSKDDISWPWNDSGMYTVREGYRAMKNTPRIENKACKIWKLHVPPRIKVFGWLMLLNKLFTIDNLHKRGWPIVNRCVLCKAQGESIKHMLHDCIFSKAVYSKLRRHLPDRLPSIDNVTPIETLTDSRATKRQKTIILIVQFCIWRERCNRTFTEESKEAKDIKEEVLW